MGLKKFLDAGQMVMGSPYDKKLKPLGEMSLSAKRRLGYVDENDCLTDRGFDRATSADDARMRATWIARKK